MLPQFEMEGFLATSGFMILLFFTLYGICSKILFSQIDVETTNGKNMLMESNNTNANITKEIHNNEKELHRIEKVITQEAKLKQQQMDKKLQESLSKIKMQLYANNQLKLSQLQAAILSKYEENNLYKILKKINRENNHDHN
jgi:hypothetical protein